MNYDDLLRFLVYHKFIAPCYIIIASKQGQILATISHDNKLINSQACDLRSQLPIVQTNIDCCKNIVDPKWVSEANLGKMNTRTNFVRLGHALHVLGW